MLEETARVVYLCRLLCGAQHRQPSTGFGEPVLVSCSYCCPISYASAVVPDVVHYKINQRLKRNNVGCLFIVCSATSHGLQIFVLAQLKEE